MTTPTLKLKTPRSIADLKADPRVSAAYHEADNGFWIELNPGWTADPRDAHDIHEDTVADALSEFRGIVPCACHSCKASQAASAPRFTSANTTDSDADHKNVNVEKKS